MSYAALHYFCSRLWRSLILNTHKARRLSLPPRLPAASTSGGDDDLDPMEKGRSCLLWPLRPRCSKVGPARPGIAESRGLGCTRPCIRKPARQGRRCRNPVYGGRSQLVVELDQLCGVESPFSTQGAIIVLRGVHGKAPQGQWLCRVVFMVRRPRDRHIILLLLSLEVATPEIKLTR